MEETEATEKDLAVSIHPAEPERRRTERLVAHIPTGVDTPSAPARFAVTRNLSTTGALLGTPSRFRIGEPAKLSLRLGDSRCANIEGRIVRLEVNKDEPGGLWRYLMAVRFRQPLTARFVAEVVADSQ